MIFECISCKKVWAEGMLIGRTKILCKDCEVKQLERCYLCEKT